MPRLGYEKKLSLRELLRLRLERQTKRMPNGCLEWQGSCMSKGYGTTMVDYKNYLTHRAAWFVEHGVWPEPMALHSCDNKKCCDVKHLFEGTNLDNIQDYTAKGNKFGRSVGS